MSKFVFSMKGLRELMKSPAMASQINQAGEIAAGIANASAPGYMTDPHMGEFTAICTVYPSNKEAGLDNYLHNTILKAVQGAGLKME